MHALVPQELTDVLVKLTLASVGGEVMGGARGSEDLKALGLRLFPEEAGGATA